MVIASQMDHIRTISLMDLIDWYDEDKKQEMRIDLMKMSKNKITFVKDYRELKQIFLDGEGVNHMQIELLVFLKMNQSLEHI